MAHDDLARQLYDYRPEQQVYRLTLDGVEVIVGTEQECWSWINTHHNYGVVHALRYVGYQIAPWAVGP